VVRERTVRSAYYVVEDAAMQLKPRGKGVFGVHGCGQQDHFGHISPRRMATTVSLRLEPLLPEHRTGNSPGLPERDESRRFCHSNCVIPAVRGTAERSSHRAGATPGQVQPGIDAVALGRALEERELLASTAIGDGIAIPAWQLDHSALMGVLGRSVAGWISIPSTAAPHLVFMLCAHGVHRGSLKALARLSRLFARRHRRTD